MVDFFECLRRTVTEDGKLKEDRLKESHQESKCCVYPALSSMEEQGSIKYTKIRIFNTNVRLVLLNDMPVRPGGWTAEAYHSFRCSWPNTISKQRM